MKALSVLTFVLLLASNVYGDDVHVGVASNFSLPLKEIAALFEAQSGDKVIVSTGSTGKLYAQISHGAPYDVFLAADQKRPALAIQEGLARAGSQFTYAFGKLAFYPLSSLDGLKQGKLARLAMANPKTAPYGVAAQETLKALNIVALYQGRIVYGENIAQTYQFVASKNVSGGFVALSQVIDKGDYWPVPEDFYTPIAQDAVLIRDNGAARAFLDFLKSPQARAVLTKYGYG